MYKRAPHARARKRTEKMGVCVCVLGRFVLPHTHTTDVVGVPLGETVFARL